MLFSVSHLVFGNASDDVIRDLELTFVGHFLGSCSSSSVLPIRGNLLDARSIVGRSRRFL